MQRPYDLSQRAQRLCTYKVRKAKLEVEILPVALRETIVPLELRAL